MQTDHEEDYTLRPSDDPMVRLAMLEGDELLKSIKLLTDRSLVKVLMHSSVRWSMFTADSYFTQATKIKNAARDEVLRRLSLVENKK